MKQKDELKLAKEALSDFNVDDVIVEQYLQSSVPKVRKLAQAFIDKKGVECKRIYNFSLYEKQLWNKGLHLVAGADEAGCGPLVGPVVAAVVVLPVDCCIWGLNDSKKLSEKKRLQLEQQIKAKAIYWSVSWVNHHHIDRYNILMSRLKAIAKAVEKLPQKPEHLLIDGNKALAMDVPQTLIVKGDSKSISIAAASVLAKCQRDRIMGKMAELFPQYGFEIHKGYPTLLHRHRIAQYGPSPIQRMSFKVKEVENMGNEE